jgi:acetyl-CoA synthetase
MEVESALVSHPTVAEAAVIGVAHPLKGQAIAAFVVLVEDVEGSSKLIEQLRNHVAEKIGPIARPDSLYLTRELPKTRSGKIMRRLLRDIAEGRLLSDTTTLADADVLGKIKEMYEERGE